MFFLKIKKNLRAVFSKKIKNGGISHGFYFIPRIKENINKRFQQCFIDRRESTKDGGFISNINKKKFGVVMYEL